LWSERLLCQILREDTEKRKRRMFTPRRASRCSKCGPNASEVAVSQWITHLFRDAKTDAIKMSRGAHGEETQNHKARGG
jgi:hypothetical protein